MGKILIPVINRQKPSKISLGVNKFLWAAEGIVTKYCFRLNNIFGLPLQMMKKIEEIYLQEHLLL